MKATQLLTTQHNKVKALFKKLEGQKGDAKELLQELSDDLAAHMAIEQNIFYPRVLEVKEDLVAESFEEHAVAEIALKRLMATDPNDATFLAKVTTLKELIEHHVEEEEGDLFPAVEKAIGDDENAALGKQMKAAFEEAKAQGFDGLVPRTYARTTADASNVVGQSTATNGHRNAKATGRAARA